MRYLILSDLHANREALEAVMASAAGKFDRLLCCGDLVGYGADPAWMVEWCRTSLEGVVRGNHDKACAGLEDLEWFNPSAKASALWTQAVLSPVDIGYLANLPMGPSLVDGFTLIHGSPVDEDEYLIQAREVAEIRDYLDTDVTFFGHTHVQGGFLVHRNGVKSFHAIAQHESSAVFELEQDSRYLINPGSVGQPRDGDPRAAYVIYNPAERVVEYFRTEYDIPAAQAKIRAAGLPPNLADRLARGT